MELRLPGIDIFLNPAKVQDKERIIVEKKNLAKEFFKNSNMRTLYPELFRLLWESTLPCFKEENKEEHMMLSCELAGVEVNCSDLFTRVPTDSGMCCALNVNDSLRASEYQELVKELQGNKTTQKVESQEGSKNGLKLILDLHSNTVSFGTLDQQYNAFNLFIGQPAQFPMMRTRAFDYNQDENTSLTFLPQSFPRMESRTSCQKPVVAFSTTKATLSSTRATPSPTVGLSVGLKKPKRSTNASHGIFPR